MSGIDFVCSFSIVVAFLYASIRLSLLSRMLTLSAATMIALMVQCYGADGFLAKAHPIALQVSVTAAYLIFLLACFRWWRESKVAALGDLEDTCEVAALTHDPSDTRGEGRA